MYFILYYDAQYTMKYIIKSKTSLSIIKFYTLVFRINKNRDQMFTARIGEPQSCCSMLYIVDIISSVSKELVVPSRFLWRSPKTSELPGRVKPDKIESIFIARANGERTILSEIENGNFSSLFSSSSFYAIFTTPAP